MLNAAPVLDVILNYSYLVSAVLFVFGLRMLSNPETARTGNIWSGVGMLLAMTVTIILHRNNEGRPIPLFNVYLIIGTILISSYIGIVIARKVRMTAMPQLVSFFNATGGLASALVGFSEYSKNPDIAEFVTLSGIVVGMVTFTGSMMAYGKLEEKVKNIFSPVMTWINIALLLILISCVGFMLALPLTPEVKIIMMYILTAFSFIYGITFVLPIGGADMPVVISLLNSFSGIAAALAGFIYSNQAMILGGILVGASGVILTLLMCKAMNRSLLNVIVGSFGGGSSMSGVEGNIREISLSDTAVLLSYSQKVVIVPGYGMAVAQAQYACNELTKLIEEKGAEVKFAIHPVAGRMPGHMNVLLAEADVPYEKLVEMDSINPLLPETDVVLIIGANDVVNPAAEEDPASPIAGMPIIRAHTAKNIIVLKRGMGKGYAAIENNLFYKDNTRMLFGDAKNTLQKLVNEVKNV